MSTQTFLFTCDGAPLPQGVGRGKESVQIPINSRGVEATLNLRADNLPSVLRSNVSDRAADLVHIAAYVYAADQEVSRGGLTDAYGLQWRRHMVMCIPVTEPEFWSQEPVSAVLANTLNLATEDSWEFHFCQAQPGVAQQCLGFDSREMYGRPDTVVLLSGGADSLCATVEAVACHGRHPLIVSHRPTAPLDARQHRLVQLLQDHFPDPVLSQVSFWANRRGSEAADSSQRSRAFLFAALGAAVASELRVPEVYLADNGVVSLNLPINAQLIGALSSRSTHPKFINAFNRLCSATLDHAPRLINPFWNRTRAEALEILKNTRTEMLLQETISCSRTRGRPLIAPQCGTCYQCVDRRFGVTAAGLEEYDLVERYGSDVFTDSAPEGDPRTVAESYVRFARQVAEVDAEELFRQFPQLQDCLIPDDPGIAGVAATFAGMIQRHGSGVLHVLETMIARHSADLASGRLPNSCLIRLATGGASPDPNSQNASNRFIQRGKAWLISFGGLSIPFADSKGLQYVQRLIRNSPDELHVFQLTQVPAPPILDDTAASKALKQELSAGRDRPKDPVIDRSSIRAILQNLKALRAERDELLEEGKDDAASEADKRVQITEELLHRSLNHKGRAREFRTHEDKDREAVSKAINRTRREIRIFHTPLWRHFQRFLHVGWLCSYEPDPPTEWVLDPE